jgi:uncharacterized metal-binding protein YceD (DUF177 family)
VKIVVRELREGSNPINFPITAIDLDGIVKDLDVLYGARADGTVDLDVQKFEGVLLLRGTLDAEYFFDCARCLAERQRALHLPIHWTLIPKTAFSDSDKEMEVELTSDDLDTSFYEGEEIDIGELAREAVLLELPVIPRCAESETCAKALEATVAEQPTKKKVDPRWGPLQAMLDSKKNN